MHTIFGYPGGAIMPFYDALLNHPIRHVLVRHEANAGFAADGYARVSGGPGVCVATSGPGATNLATALASAWMDSVPVVAITGQVSSWLVGTDGFQETDVTGMMLPVTKWNTLVTRPDDLESALVRAFDVAVSGRPGPVLVDVCKDVQSAPAVTGAARRPAPCAPERIAQSTLTQLQAVITGAHRPLLMAGHGVLGAGAEDLLLRLAEEWKVPVATTLLGLGAFPETHELSLGMMGMHGDTHVNEAVDAADLLVAVGMRFDDRVTGTLDTYARNAKVIHIEFDPAEVGKNVAPDVALVCDARAGLEALLSLRPPNVDPRWTPSQVDHENQAYLARIDADTFVAPQAIDLIDRIAADDAIIVTDVGQHQMWEAQFLSHSPSRRLLTSGGAGAMGYAVGAAMGASAAAPGREVWVIVGDGGFQMSSPELATLAQDSIAIKVVVVNNGYLGMVRQWQELFYDSRYSFTRLSSPDLVMLAAAHGLDAHRACSATNANLVLQRAKAATGPVLVELEVLAEDSVLPMIAPGKPVSEMIRRRPDSDR